MKYVFYCSGHENIRAKHTKTIEFTKDTNLTPRGDCIIGVKADFDLAKIKELWGRVKVTVEVEGLQDTFWAIISPAYDDDHEMVFRRSRFASKRTLGVQLNKGAIGLNRDIVQSMKNPAANMKVILECTSEARSRQQTT